MTEYDTEIYNENMYIFLKPLSQFYCHGHCVSETASQLKNVSSFDYTTMLLLYFIRRVYALWKNDTLKMIE